MVRKTIFVSDLFDKTIDDDKKAVTITLKFGDGGEVRSSPTRTRTTRSFSRS